MNARTLPALFQTFHMDNRWPHLLDLSAIPNIGAEKSRLVWACESVRRRTDFRVLYNSLTKCLWFYIGEPDCAAAIPNGAVQVFDHCGVSRVFKFDGVWVDEVCRMLRQGRAPRAVKDRHMAYAAASVESDRKSAENREWSDGEKRFEQIGRRVKNRSGMSSKFRPSALVNGSKGIP